MINDLYKTAQKFIGQAGGPFAPTKKSPGSKAMVKQSPIRLRDRNNVDSELSPFDFEDMPSYSHDPRERALLQLCQKRFRASAIQRYMHEREWVMSTGFDRGNQFVEWRDATNRPELLLDPNDPNRSYVTANLIGNSIIPKLLAYATMTSPDAMVRPLTRRPIDAAAAAEARDILAHYDQEFGQAQMLEWVDLALTMSTTFLKVIWVPTKEALIGYFDHEQGLVVENAPVGDIDEIVVPPLEVYPDAKARSWKYLQHLTHAKRMPLTWFQETFGDRGRAVKGEPFGLASGWASWWETRLDSITGEAYRSTNLAGQDDSALYYECWELPTPRYPKGRLIRYANDLILTEPDELDWPYERNDAFPFVPLGFKNKFGTIWALNAVHDAIPIQRIINEEISRMNDLMETERPTILVPEGGKVKYSDTQDRRLYAEIRYAPGLAPTYQLPPPVGAHRFQFLESMMNVLEDITGVHDVSKARVPANLDSGVAIAITRESDTTVLKGFLTNIEKACEERAKWRIAHAAQFFDEPRLMSIAQSDDDNDIAMDVKSFEALTNGGKCRVVVVPGSATYQSPEQRIARWMDILKSGALSNPQGIPALLAIFDQIGFELSDTMAQNLKGAIQDMMAIEQQLNGSPQQQAAAQAQAQAQIAQVQAQIELMKTHIQAQYNAQTEDNRTKADIAIAANKAQVEAQADTREFAAKLALQEHDKTVPNTSIAAKLTLGSQAAPSAEQMMGLTPDNPAEIKEMNKKPEPAPKTGGGSSSSSSSGD